MSTKLVIGVTAGLAVGVAAGWLAGGTGAADAERLSGELAAAELERDAVTDEKSSAEAELESVKRQLSRLDRDLVVARAALATAEEDAATLRAQVAVEADAAAQAAAAEPGPEPGALPNGQTFSFSEYDESLAAIDWKSVGSHMSAMTPLLSEVMTAVANGESPSPEAIGGVQRHNGPLVTAAMTLHGKLPGESVNGAFTHPSAAVNMIASTLDALDMPLTAEQKRALDKVGHDFVAEDERRIAGYTEETLDMRRWAEESEMKGRFYAAAMGLLSQEQHDALRPETTRGRVTVDLFDASVIWVGRVRPVPFQTREALAETLSDRIGRGLEVEGETKARLNATITDWVNGLPNELMTREPDALWLKGLVPIDVIDLSAMQQVTMMESLIRDVGLSDHAVAELRDHAGVFVPTWRPAN